MAASYQTGTASSPIVLLQTIVTWLVAQGWTQDASASDGSGWRAHLHKGGQYVNLRAAMNENNIWAIQNATAGYGVGLYLGDGYSGASAWNAQSGGPLSSGTASRIGAAMKLDGAGAVSAYHLFDDGADHITIVVEKAPGLFVHVGWGPSLVKTGYTYDAWYFYGSTPSYYTTSTPSSGPYPGHEITAAAPFSQSFYSSQHYSVCFARFDAAVFADRWIGSNDSSGSTNYGNTGRQGRCALLHPGVSIGSLSEQNYFSYRRLSGRNFQSAFTGAPLWPLHFYVNTQPQNRWAPVGYPPTVFHTTAVGHGNAAAEVVSIGGLNYMLFPNFAVRKAA